MAFNDDARPQLDPEQLDPEQLGQDIQPAGPDPRDIEKIAKGVDPEKGSILDDATALSALSMLKQELYEKDCKLIDFKIGFDSTGFDIKGLNVKCSNPQKILDALRDVETVPGQLKPQSMFDKMPNSYSMSAILGTLKRRAEDELGLSLRAASYENDYVVLSFFPAEEKEELMPEEPPMEEPPMEEPPEETEAEPSPDAVPSDEIDWEAMGI